AFSTMPLDDPTWNMDTGASFHLNSHSSNLSTVYNNCLYPSVRVGETILVTNTGHSILPILSRLLYLHNVLVTPNIIKNLIYVLQFTRDNKYTIEFDEFRFPVKDFLTRHILLRYDSSGDLYPVTKSYPIPSAFLSISPTTWHQRLGHPGAEVLRYLISRNFISCNKEKSSHICHACQLGKHVNLPFASSDTRVSSCFDIIHYDIWTSPILLKRNPRFNLHTSHISPLPKSPSIALSDPNRRAAMYDEYNALVKNSTWTTLEARKGVGKAFVVAFRSGAVMGFLLAANGLLVLYIAINLFKLYYGSDWEGPFGL
ncbi:ribonuclease H-like domain-containing protein, partial [Tanacetum coccineum]